MVIAESAYMVKEALDRAWNQGHLEDNELEEILDTMKYHGGELGRMVDAGLRPLLEVERGRCKAWTTMSITKGGTL